jgi:histidine triad (HIT) family protein
MVSDPARADCPFCGRIDANDVEIVWEDVVAFTPLNPVTPGHLLVVPDQHVEDARTDPLITAEVMRRAAEVARDAGECNIITSAGAAATQTVQHLHVHVVPRREGDGLLLPWTHPAEAVQTLTDAGPLESFYAIRRTDGELMGEYGWLQADDPDDWSGADVEIFDGVDPIEFEIVRMIVVPVAKRTLPESTTSEEGGR